MLDLLNKGRVGITNLGEAYAVTKTHIDAANATLAKDARAAFVQLDEVLTNTKNLLGLVFAPIFKDAAEALALAVAKNKDAIAKWANDLKNLVLPVITQLIDFIGGKQTPDNTWIFNWRDAIVEFGGQVKDIIMVQLPAAFDTLVKFLDKVAKGINELFGTNFTGKELGIGLIITQFLGLNKVVLDIITLITNLGILLIGLAAVGGWPVLLGAALVGIGAIIVAELIKHWPEIKQAFSDGVDWIKKKWAELKELPPIKPVVFTPTQEGQQTSPTVDRTSSSIREFILGGASAIFEGLQTLFGKAKDALSKIWDDIVAIFLDFTPVTKAFTEARSGIETAWTGLVEFFKQLFKDIIAAADLAPVKKAFSGLLEFFQQLFKQIIEAANFTPIKEAFASARSGIEAAWNGLVEFFKKLFEDIIAAANFTSITDAFTNAETGIETAWNGLISFFQQLFQQIIDAANSMADSVAQAAQRAAASVSQISWSSNPFLANQPTSLAGGGHVRGPGTTTSDSIMAFLSDYEFVQPAIRVKQYGLDFMEAIRRGTLSVDLVRMLMGDLKGFSFGGLVMPPIRSVPAFADGGLNRVSKTPVLLMIGGQKFSMEASEETVKQLRHVSNVAQYSSTGRKPRSYR